MTGMSAETTRLLQEAIAEEDRAREDADLRKRECLAKVAADLPTKVADIARTAAHNQAEVTKALGKDGVARMRTELADAVSAVAIEVAGAIDNIWWPARDHHEHRVTPEDIHIALTKYLNDGRVHRIAAVLKRQGFDVGEDRHSGVPQLFAGRLLCETGSIGPVATAMNVLIQASAKTASAKDTDDRSAVDEIWAD
jgi:hypothetical protein